jgi:2-polyprenyl-3-methyl-5-hydroxy-6-metoxy-1,4-benzoquinol methylase
MVLLSQTHVETLARVCNDHPELVSVAAAEIGLDHPENSPLYPYYTLRGFRAFTEAMTSQPQVVEPLVERDPFAFMLEQGQVPLQHRDIAVVDLPSGLPTEQSAIAPRLFVHPLTDYYRHPRLDIVRHLPDSITSLLDVGCGSGVFGQVVREKWGCRVVGVELNPAAAADARSVLDQVILGNIIDQKLDERFDVITVNDVLEHTEDPQGLLERLSGFAKPNGRLILSIPNVGHWSVVEDLLAGHWDYLPAGLLCIDHLRFFTRDSAISMIEDAGWQAISVLPIPGPMPEKVFRLFCGISSQLSKIEFENLNSQGYIIVASKA